ncbi:MAG: formate dehydrogenase accessory sulfurtransferase FdhD [Bacteroidetes bacterium]|nr:formate dehydrogenase accessory sulfurtransferase FdhD [Bacteroidota bacterium]
MSQAAVSKVSIQRFLEGKLEDAEDLVAVEEPLEIRIGHGKLELREQWRISVTMRTPGHDFELALGFLFTEGIIKNVNEIASIKYCTELNTLQQQFNIVRVELKEDVLFDAENLQRNFYTTSSCGVCGKASIESIKQHCDRVTHLGFEPSTSLLFKLTQQLDSVQTVFKFTGGIHACALFNAEGRLVLMREDVGRHNALDKLIGAALTDKHINLSKSILLLSGRASFELVQKAAMAGIPIIAAIGAPSSLAVSTAHEFGIRLYGFLKQEKFNLY